MSSHLRRRSSSRASFLSLSLTLFFMGLVLLWPNTLPILATPPAPLPVTPTPAPVNLGPIHIDPSFFHQPSSSFPPPTRLIIPRLNLDLPVTESPIINGYWQLSDSTASHGQGSASPGQPGNIVIFAHARPGLFLPLRQIEAGTNIYVLTSRSWHLYRVDRIVTVSPDQTEIVSPTSAETLTLYTCSGFADSRRLVVQAHPL